MSLTPERSAPLDSIPEANITELNSTDNENKLQLGSPSKQTVGAISPQLSTPGPEAAKQPSRTPMARLSQNPQGLPSATSSPLLPALRARTPDGVMYGGSTTHRDSRVTSPGQWLPAMSSGAFTARGSGSVPCAILKPPAKLGFASVPARQQGSNAAVAKAAALNPQALPYVPPGGGSPSIKDLVAHAEAALHQLKQVVEAESWRKEGMHAMVQKKETDLKGLQQDLDRLVQDRKAGLEELKQLSEQQQALHAQLNQSHQECDAISRQLERLQRENMALQNGIAEAQEAAQQSLVSAHEAHQQAKTLTQRQVQLQSSIDGLKAVQQIAKQEANLNGSMCQALEASLHDHAAAANTAESASSQHQAAAIKLLQQSVAVLGIRPEQLFSGLVQRLKDDVRGDYEQQLKAAHRKAVMAQTDAAIASAQNTSRSLGQGTRALPTPSLDLKSLSLRETFSSLTDSSRGRTASARTASGLSARQPLSASDRYPSMPSGRSLGNALASLSEEPNASGKVLEVSGSSSLLEIQCAALQHSGSSPHSAAEDEVDRLPSDRPCSDKGAEGTASAGSSEYSSSSGSYYNSSNNSSRSSSPVADEDDENGLDDINTDAQQGNNLPEVPEKSAGSNRQGSIAVAVPRLPTLPLANALPSAGATPRSVRFQLRDDRNQQDRSQEQKAALPLSARQHPAEDLASLLSPLVSAANASRCSEPPQENPQNLKAETSFAFDADAQTLMISGQTMKCSGDCVDGVTASVTHTTPLNGRHEGNSRGDAAEEKETLNNSAQEATISIQEEVLVDENGVSRHVTGPDSVADLIARMRRRFEVTDQMFELGRYHAKKGLAGLPE